MAEIALAAAAVGFAAVQVGLMIKFKIDERDAKSGRRKLNKRDLSKPSKTFERSQQKSRGINSVKEATPNSAPEQQLLQELKKILQHQKRLEEKESQASNDIRTLEDVNEDADQLIDMAINLENFSRPIQANKGWRDLAKSFFASDHSDQDLIDDVGGKRTFCQGALLYQSGRVEMTALHGRSVDDGFQCNYCYLNVKNVSSKNLPRGLDTGGIYGDVLAASHLLAHDGSGNLDAYYRCVVCAERSAPNDFRKPSGLVAHVAIHHALEPLGYIRRPIDRDQLEKHVDALLEEYATPNKVEGKASQASLSPDPHSLTSGTSLDKGQEGPGGSKSPLHDEWRSDTTRSPLKQQFTRKTTPSQEPPTYSRAGNTPMATSGYSYIYD